MSFSLIPNSRAIFTGPHQNRSKLCVCRWHAHQLHASPLLLADHVLQKHGVHSGIIPLHHPTFHASSVEVPGHWKPFARNVWICLQFEIRWQCGDRWQFGNHLEIPFLKCSYMPSIWGPPANVTNRGVSVRSVYPSREHRRRSSYPNDGLGIIAGQSLEHALCIIESSFCVSCVQCRVKQ